MSNFLFNLSTKFLCVSLLFFVSFILFNPLFFKQANFKVSLSCRHFQGVFDIFKHNKHMCFISGPDRLHISNILHLFCNFLDADYFSCALFSCVFDYFYCGLLSILENPFCGSLRPRIKVSSCRDDLPFLQ